MPRNLPKWLSRLRRGDCRNSNSEIETRMFPNGRKLSCCRKRWIRNWFTLGWFVSSRLNFMEIPRVSIFVWYFLCRIPVEFIQDQKQRVEVWCTDDTLFGSIFTKMNSVLWSLWSPHAISSKKPAYPFSYGISYHKSRPDLSRLENKG